MTLNDVMYPRRGDPSTNRAQELCESGGGRPGLPVLIVRTVSVVVKQHSTALEPRV